MSLHDRIVVIDSLQVGGDWPQEVIDDIRASGLTAVGVTSVVWEDSKQALSDIGLWNRRFRKHPDVFLPVRIGADILRAKREGRTGVIYGFQNASPFEDTLDYVEIFGTLGVKVCQLTYNNQNSLGGSCYEAHDSGLSRFGRNVVREMNRVGMIVDLSHVGEQTSLDAIEHSTRPVAVTHGNPTFIHPHKRNKSEKVLTALRERGGMIGFTPYPNLSGIGTTLVQWCDQVKRVVAFMGIDRVGIGSDMARGWADFPGHVNWVRMGTWTHEIDYGAGTPGRPWGYEPFPDWFAKAAEFRNLTEGLLANGFNETEVTAIMGGNWLRFFSEGFEPE